MSSFASLLGPRPDWVKVLPPPTLKAINDAKAKIPKISEKEQKEGEEWMRWIPEEKDNIKVTSTDAAIDGEKAPYSTIYYP